MDLREITGPVDKPYSLDSKLDKFNSNVNKLSSINKAMKLNIDSVEELCEIWIESKYTKIIKLKRITPTIRRLQEIDANV